MEKIILAQLNCLPELVNGKVIIITDNKPYAYSVSRYCVIKNNYNPINYCLLKTDKYTCIVYSNNSDKETYNANKQLKDLNICKLPIRVGDRIHIHSRIGMYTIYEILKTGIVITCNRWQYSDSKYVQIGFDDFKCLAGGYNNAVFE